jgi:hypothetical protein
MIKRPILLLPCFLLISGCLFSQVIKLEKSRLEAINVLMSIEKLGDKEVVKVIKDTAAKGADQPTYVRFKVLSRLLPEAVGTSARGFIGVAFRINSDNSKFESIYIRPTNGRADDQLRRNHSIQYFSYPDYGFQRLRNEAAGQYESYADMGLNEWIKLRIVIKDAQAKFFLNDNLQPSLIVNDLKLGPNNKGAIGLFVDGGTQGYFSDVKVLKD